MMTKLPMPVQNFMDAAQAGTMLPPLYATTKRPYSGRSNDGTITPNPAGQRVRVIRTFKSGDVGISIMLDQDKADEARATFAELTDFSEQA